MHAQPAGLGHRIDEMVERAFDRQADIVAFGKMQHGNIAQALDALRHMRSPKAGGIHHQPRVQHQIFAVIIDLE